MVTCLRNLRQCLPSLGARGAFSGKARIGRPLFIPVECLMAKIVSQRGEGRSGLREPGCGTFDRG